MENRNNEIFVVHCKRVGRMHSVLINLWYHSNYTIRVYLDSVCGRDLIALHLRRHISIFNMAGVGRRKMPADYVFSLRA